VTPTPALQAPPERKKTAADFVWSPELVDFTLKITPVDGDTMTWRLRMPENASRTEIQRLASLAAGKQLQLTYQKGPRHYALSEQLSE
jgi:hypothetical protein